MLLYTTLMNVRHYLNRFTTLTPGRRTHPTLVRAIMIYRNTAKHFHPLGSNHGPPLKKRVQQPFGHQGFYFEGIRNTVFPLNMAPGTKTNF